MKTIYISLAALFFIAFESVHAEEGKIIESFRLSQAETNQTTQLTEYEMQALEQGRIDAGSTVAGAIVGGTLGGGLGHVFIGRYWPRGIFYSLVDAGLGILALISLRQALDAAFCENDCDGKSGSTMAGVVVVGALASRAVQIADITLTHSAHNSAYDRAIEKQNRSKLGLRVLPSFAQNRQSLALQLNF